ncbi:hypothetical protein H0H87_011259 [Tephrocybe sp. NHM501043]|nr:hypothetical protein H0H87_011259 [Tephrocybe sp. NHM501043]
MAPGLKSIYFDAPMEPQQQQAFTILSDQPGDYSSAAPVTEQVDRGAIASQADVTDKDHVVQHPEDDSGWLPAVDLPSESQTQQTDNGFQAGGSDQQRGLNVPQRNISIRDPSAKQRGHNLRSPSPKGYRGFSIRSPSPIQGSSAQGATDVRRSASRRSMFTGSTGQPIEGSTFIGGAATTGPHSTAQAHEDLTTRAAAADANLSRKDRSRITKSEAEDGRRLSKIIKDEGAAEKQALGLSLNELAMLQKEQANAIKNEAVVHQKRAKLQAECRKQEALYMAAQTKYETAKSRLKSEDDSMEIVRNKARDALEKLQEKSQEVDSLRTMFAVDERERAAKLAMINQKPQRAGSGCVIA